MPTRRATMVRAALLSATVLAAGMQAAAAADLVIGAYGGVWEQSLRQCMVEPWQKKTGKTVDLVLGTPVQLLNQVAASQGRPPIDLLYDPTETVLDATARNLVDPLTPENVPNMALLAPDFARLSTAEAKGAVQNYGAMGVIYNKTTVKARPASWKALVDGVLAGTYRVAMPSVNYPAGGLAVSVWWFAKLFGGDANNVQPGLDQIRKMRDSGNLVFWTDPNQVLNLLKGGDVDMALYWDGRAWAFIDGGNPDFDYYTPEPGAVVALTWMQKMKGGSDLAYSFANQALSTESQACFGSAIRYGVANGQATYDPKIAHEITPAKNLVFPPYKDIAANTGKWIELWNKQVGR